MKPELNKEYYFLGGHSRKFGGMFKIKTKEFIKKEDTPKDIIETLKDWAEHFYGKTLDELKEILVCEKEDGELMYLSNYLTPLKWDCISRNPGGSLALTEEDIEFRRKEKEWYDKGLMFFD